MADAEESKRYKTGGWNLSELASGPDDPHLAEQADLLRQKASAFEAERKRLSPRMSSRRFGRMLNALEEIAELGSRTRGYASLLHAADTQSDRATSLLMGMSKLDSEISNRTLFFSLWWKRDIDPDNAERLASGAGELAEYLRHKRRLAEYSLSEPEEKIVNTLDVTGASALVNIYDKITGAYQYKLRINKRVRTMTREQVSRYVRSASPRLRKSAYTAILARYESEKGVMGEIYQNIVQNWTDTTVKMRGYGSQISARNTDNDIDDRTVDSLLAVCRRNAPVFQRFFRLKAEILKMSRLRRYDLYAPVTVPASRASGSGSGRRKYTYGAAARLVCDTLGAFSPALGAFAKRVIEEDHVDSAARRGKHDGAFCSTISPRVTPYILMSFTGRTKDLFTLAHEMGHAVHSQAAGSRSILVQHAPLPLAETASTFSEMLLYDVIAGRVSERERLAILAEKIDDMYATIARQAYFTTFEIEAHKRVAGGGTVDDLSRAYMDILREQFGGSVDVSDDFAIEWSCIPHFYHSPFYCYAYSFGNLLSLALLQRYKKEGAGFVPSYMEILAAGGSQKPEDLLAAHGFDITAEAFWEEGFEYVAGQVEELAGMVDRSHN